MEFSVDILWVINKQTNKGLCFTAIVKLSLYQNLNKSFLNEIFTNFGIYNSTYASYLYVITLWFVSCLYHYAAATLVSVTLLSTYWKTVDGIKLIMQLLNHFIIMNCFGEKVRADLTKVYVHD